MKGLLIFGLMTLVVGGFLLFLFMHFFVIWIGPQTANPLKTPDQVQALTALFGLFVGSAASIGGAVATLQLASLGLEISKRQEMRDDTAFIDEKASNAIKLYSELLVSIGSVFSSGVIVDMKIPSLEKEGLLEKFEEKVSEELKLEMLQLSEKVVQLIDALNNILKDDFSHYCIQQQASSFEGKLSHISRGLIDLGMHPSEVTVSISNLSDIVALLEVASRRIDDGKLGDLVQARLFANSSNIGLFNIPYDHRNVRSFFFLGNIIFARSETESPSGKLFIASYGAAILHDLIKIIPDGTAISESLSARYPLLHQVNKHQIYFEPANVTSRNLLSAIAEAEKIGDLYLLISDEQEDKIEKGREEFLGKLRYLKNMGINDPEIDMFIAVMQGDEVLLTSALERGANPNITDAELIERYEKQLSDF